MADYRVEFQPSRTSVQCKDNESILECSRKLNIGINNTCGGRGTCATCKIRLINGVLTPPTGKETNIFAQDEIQNGWRLACQSYPSSDCTVNVPSESLSTLQRIQYEGIELQVKPDPPVHVYPFSMTSPTLSDQLSDDQRLIAAAKSVSKGTVTRIDFNLQQTLSDVLRELNWSGTVSMRNGEIISINSPADKNIGLAIDLGTTKVAGYIINLETGEKIASDGIINPQVLYGDDVISRITAAMKSPDSAVKLQKLIVKGINDLAKQLCASVNSNVNTIKETVIVCNTAMHHLLLRLPVKQLALSPFIPAVSNSLDIKAREIGLEASPGSYIHILPNIAGYVGADHVAAILSSNIVNDTGPSVIMDIGTNTEISLHFNKTITAVSCASGPAFEGAHIKNGMRATSGAIEKVLIENGNISYQTIGNTKPIGICGSGMLDALAQMYHAGIVDKSGRLNKEHKHVLTEKGLAQFILADISETENQHPIVIAQKDIRELQLAKAAIRAAIKVLLQENNFTEQDVQRIIIAGAFGTYIDINSAKTIGLVPQLPNSKFHQIGNAAGMGAVLSLISMGKRRETEEIAKKAKYIELADNKYFMKSFIDSNYLGS
jgi:uncharacterized 2Fe-2S/4Fe-4S cluster protein (DUF4445 family)